MLTLSRALPKAFWALLTSFKSVLIASSRALTGFCSVVNAIIVLWPSSSVEQLASKAVTGDITPKFPYRQLLAREQRSIDQ